MENIYGLVLCGGKSQRMGKDKGLLQRENGQTWSAFIASILQSKTNKVFYSINQKQSSAYKEIFNPEFLIEDAHPENINGPLKGILSAHKLYPEKSLFVVSCDLQMLSASLISEILDNHVQEPDFDVVLFKDERFFHPTCALYTRNGLQKLFSAYKKKELQNASMHKALSFLNVKVLPASQDNQKNLRNFNNPEDIVQFLN